jgi:serine/threonine-protein kinase SRPK3
LEQPNIGDWECVEQTEKTRPSWAIERDGRVIYESLVLPGSIRPGAAKLADFGLAVRGPGPFSHPIQPFGMEAPEVLIGAQWSYSADVWNLGVLVSLQLGLIAWH